MTKLPERNKIDSLIYTTESHNPWLPSNLVTHRESTFLTPTECVNVITVDAIIFKIMYGE